MPRNQLGQFAPFGRRTPRFACRPCPRRYVSRQLIGFFLPFLFLPNVVFGQGIPVKDALAGLIEAAVVETGLVINIVPDEMSETALNINTIGGISVCDAEAEEDVRFFQAALASDSRLHQTISSYGVYLNSESGVRYLRGDNPEIAPLIGECKYLYVSVL